MKRMLYFVFALLTFVSQIHSSNISWSISPEVLSGVNANASEPQVVIDTHGNAVAAWIEGGLVKASSKPVNGNWTSAVTISAAGASSLSLISDSNGNATAVWIGNGNIKAATKPLNANWSSVTNLSYSGASSPTMCVDSAGDVVAAWVRNGSVETSIKFFGMSWQSPSVVYSASTAYTPSLAIGGSGSNARVVVAWQGKCCGVKVVFASIKPLGGFWSSGQVISDTDHNAVQPSVAVDSNTNILATWYEYDIIGQSYTNVVVKSAERPFSTGVWSSASSLSAPGIGDPSTFSARIAFDSTDNAIGLWNISFDGQTFTLESAVKPVNGKWSDPVDLVNSNLYALSADFSATTFGDVLGLYLFYNGTSLLIQSVESDFNDFLNNIWSVPITLSLGNENAYPKIAAALTGNVINAAAVWLNNNGVYNSVVTSTGSKTLVLPPSNLSVAQGVQNFGVFSEYYNTLSWQASTDPNVVGYLIFRNGAFIDQVGADVLQYIDNNRTLNAPVTYSMTAIDALQTQSPTVSVSFP